jgi:hypothetical protein
LGCLDFVLPEKYVKELDAASEIAMGFPHEFLASDNVRELVYGGKWNDIKSF